MLAITNKSGEIHTRPAQNNKHSPAINQLCLLQMTQYRILSSTVFSKYGSISATKTFFCQIMFEPTILLAIYPSVWQVISSGSFNSPSIHPFGELFSSCSIDSPSVHPFGELFSSRPFYSSSVHPFDEAGAVQCLLYNRTGAKPFLEPIKVKTPAVTTRQKS